MVEIDYNKLRDEHSTEKKYSRIAKNTVFLFFRMIFSMGISLFTSRILLEKLGVEDYGIYNIVGGFVAMFSIVSGALTGAISRFITFELGKGDINILSRTFKSSVVVMIGISLIIILVGETIGLWFLYNKLVIPEARLTASFWVFQFAIITFILGLLSTPYTACIVSHEKMDAFAYISILEVICKLLICFILVYAPIDRLVFFSVLLCVVGVLVRFIYIQYCKKKFEECRGPLVFDKKITQNMFSYAGWSFIGSTGWILKSQGGSILLNLFGGPIVNAANAIAASLSGAVTNLVNCFTTSLNPQITKSYANKQYSELRNLLIYGPKISYYLLFIVALPVLLNTEFILNLWLGVIPEHTVNFVRLVLLISLIDIISVPLVIAKNATGKIRNYQIVVGSIQLLALPLAYIFLKIGATVELLYVAYIIVSVLCLFARIIMINGDFPNWSFGDFAIKVCFNIAIVSAIAAILPTIIFLQMQEGWNRLFITSLVSVISCGCVIYFIGLNRHERSIIALKVKDIIAKFRK